MGIKKNERRRQKNGGVKKRMEKSGIEETNDVGEINSGVKKMNGEVLKKRTAAAENMAKY